MDATIGELRRNARLRRIIAPAHARVIGVGGVGVVAVGKFRDDKADASKIAARHHRLHVTHEGIAGVAIVDGADLPGFARDPHDLFALFHRHRHRLFAKDVEPGLKERLGDLIMGGVRRGDGDKIDTVGAALLALQHLSPVAIGAVGCKAKAAAIITPGVGSVIQRARRKGEQPVKPGPKTVRGSDLAALATADHSPIQFRHVGPLS
ncbi:hypothetical protein GALL_548370 [mine drainage metagenome]|uniref:Uncharacterized protein n=1 Tax=mine drainage metagenome TaxID=410659 RepID=A0A1J5P761_9ZZZZ